ncbi:unnamed protein product [Brassicogethes aeneus]|uniref:Origin recognition complex subunit 6 n=1 Tax=Brassicogethes aeneus TaxID=1431903 RepID=A0A9P0AYR2_BRAAE|nr:unnamed protein product [Brassicogethes aeneus]
MSNDNLLQKTAQRLGVYQESVINKTREFLRVLSNKGSIKCLNENAKTILCFDLASILLGTPFDKETAIKLSGLKKSLYNNNHNTLEKVLDLNKQLSISELCVQMSCTVVKDIAEDIFDKYKNFDNKIKDLNHPQYAAAAVFTACKLKHVGVNKSQFATVSRLKPAQWKELTEEFKKFAETIGMTGGKKRQKANENKNEEEMFVEVVSAADYKPEVVASNPIRGMAVYLCLSYCLIVLRGDFKPAQLASGTS